MGAPSPDISIAVKTISVSQLHNHGVLVYFSILDVF